jgi:hypothetical protein
MEIEKINIKDIEPYENNAKLHPTEQIEQIKKSIQEFGNNDPIAIDENNVIIEGHGRYIALQELGYTEVEVIKLKHLTDEQKKAYMLVHNKLTMNSDFDIELLSEELGNIIDVDMSVYGFDSMNDIDWASVDDLNEESYEAPTKDMLECPHCHHIDSKNHFKKVDGLQVAENN